MPRLSPSEEAYAILMRKSDRSRISSFVQRTINVQVGCQQLGNIQDLNRTVVLNREALSLRPPGHPDRSEFVRSLAVHLSSRYERLGIIDDLNEAIILDREALSLYPPGHPDRSMFLNKLAVDLFSRYKQLGGTDDLNEALALDWETLSLRPPGHSDYSMALVNLAKHLSSRYEQFGGIDDLNDAVDIGREAVSLHPPGHPDRSMSLNDLAVHLSFRYEQLGGIDDLDEAIVLAREAVSLRPPGHRDRSTSLNSLANRLSFRYEQLGGIDDLNEAITLGQEALSLRPSGHPDRSTSLNDLAVHLSFRYEHLGVVNDLNKAIVLGWEALLLRPIGHPGRSTSLSNLANNFSSRYEQFGAVCDLRIAIYLDREALSLRPPGHPDRSISLSNLADDLSSQYKQPCGTIDDLNEAISLDQEALSLRPPGHPDRSMSLSNLATHLSSRYEQLTRIGDLNAAFLDKQELFGLYTELEHVSQTVSSADLSAAKSWINAAEKFCHPTTLLAYETALRLLVQHLAALPSLPHHLDLLKSLSSSLAVDAFSACLRNHSPAKAVELLEQGRAVFWNQLTRLRSPLDDVIKSGPQGKVLADEFTRLTLLVRKTINSPGSGQHDRACRLNLELQRVVSKIRELPGHSRFLLPSLFSDLQKAAEEGPVIIMNASKYSCDALIILFDKDPIHIPLPVTKENVREMSSRLRDLRAVTSKKMKKMEKDFINFLRTLWDRVVSHIVNVLRAMCPPHTRIWWCPTGEFSLLPLHAAAPYREGQKYASCFYFSSYTTTLTALIRARRPGLLHCATRKKHFIAVGQAAAKGPNKLLYVDAELDNIAHVIQGLTTFMRIEGEDACVSNVAGQLDKNEWVHVACHGIRSQENPFESAFALRDGPLTIQRIIQCDLQNPEFAYLSACHTTVGDQESPDEVIHLAAAMQFAGFRSVIGTMWAVDDYETTKVAPLFYKLMIDESGYLDYTRAGRALWMAVKMANISIEQRILYVHIGA